MNIAGVYRIIKDPFLLVLFGYANMKVQVIGVWISEDTLYGICNSNNIYTKKTATT